MLSKFKIRRPKPRLSLPLVIFVLCFSLSLSRVPSISPPTSPLFLLIYFYSYFRFFFVFKLFFFICFMCAGIFFILPCIDNYARVDLRTRTYDVPPQEVRRLLVANFFFSVLFLVSPFFVCVCVFVAFFP